MISPSMPRQWDIQLLSLSASFSRVVSNLSNLSVDFISKMFSGTQQCASTLTEAPGRLRSKFTVAEDERLKAMVHQFPTSSWAAIAAMFPGKTIRQVRERYRNYLCPDLNHMPWTMAEDRLLREKFAIFGPRWSALRQFFDNRSDVSIKNRWACIAPKYQTVFSPSAQCQETPQSPLPLAAVCHGTSPSAMYHATPRCALPTPVFHDPSPYPLPPPIASNETPNFTVPPAVASNGTSKRQPLPGIQTLKLDPATWDVKLIVSFDM
jgi:hypothetical protein